MTMFDLPYPNTRYAEALDYDQQLDYEMELYNETTSLEEREAQEFAERCRKSKVSATRLKKYEVELRKIQSKAGKELSELEWKARATKSAKERSKLRAKQSSIRKQLEADEQALHDHYFKAKKR